MLHFHTNVFARPRNAKLGRTVQLRGIEFSTYAGPDGKPPVFDLPLPLSFEQIQERLLAIPRMDIEPDGYFLVAGGEQHGQRWQIDGHLHEYNDRMHRVEMHGGCSEQNFNHLLRCFGWPECEVVFQLVHEGATLSEADFRRFAKLV